MSNANQRYSETNVERMFRVKWPQALVVLPLVVMLCSSVGLAQPATGADTKPWEAGISEATRAAALKLFREGNAFFASQAYARAIDRYSLALKAWDHPRIHGNLATALVHLDAPVRAKRHLDRALKYGRRPFQDRVYSQLLTNRKLLEGQLAEMTITCPVAGVQVTLDGKLALTGPGSAVSTVRAGKHQVVAKKTGYLTQTKMVSLHGRQKVELKLVMVPLDQATRVERKWATWKPWVVLGAGAAVTIAGLAFGQASGSAIARYENALVSECPMRGCTLGQIPAGIVAHQDRARLWNRLEVSAYMIGGATLIGGAALVYLNRERFIRVSESGARIGVAPSVSPTLVGVLVGGRF